MPVVASTVPRQRWPAGRHRQAIALTSLGLVLQETGHVDDAIAAHRDAVAIFRETGDRHRESITLANLRKAQAAQPE